MDDQTDPSSGGEPTQGAASPGWYADATGTTRWWDGTQWGLAAPNPQTQAPPPPPPQAPPPSYSGYASYTAPGLSPPPPPWGSWTWADGQPIDMATLPPYDPSKKLTAGILAIVLGGLGIHKFMLGYTSEGIVMILLVLCGISPIIGLIEGIIYLTKSDPEFYWTYVAGRKTWF